MISTMFTHSSRSQSFACGALPRAAAPRAVGHKAANLIAMANVGLPVPPGFVCTTDVCRDFFARGGQPLPDLPSLLAENVQRLEAATGRRFGGDRCPLLVAVRSGAPVSMPGMMATVLNVGLCDATVDPMIRMTGNPRCVWDSYRRLVQSFGEVVHSMPTEEFAGLTARRQQEQAALTLGELDVVDLREIARESLVAYRRVVGESFPQDPRDQVRQAVEAVFRSWRSPRAVAYRQRQGIDDDIGTAVTVQAMVFGNMGSTSGSGVAFTRDPNTGAHELYLGFLWNAQGEDVVAGRHNVLDAEALKRQNASIALELKQLGDELERLFLDAQDIEFTIQEGKVFLLQSRTALRTPVASLRIACDMVRDSLIDEREALKRLSAYDLESLQVQRLATVQERPLASGTAACPGVACGPIALDSESAVARDRQGVAPILVRRTIAPDDFAGMVVAGGVLTSAGGPTSHAAVIARQMNKPCIVGCRDLVIKGDQRCLIGEASLSEGDVISLDGRSGAVYAGRLDVVTEKPVELLAIAKRWQERAEAHATGRGPR